MDRKALVKNLRGVFSNSEIRDKYSMIWLSHIDFGGLYHTETRFDLNVAPKQKVITKFTEIRYVTSFLHSNAKDEAKQIMAVKIHSPEIDTYDVRTDMILYAEQE
jgi:hypothetical protein